MVIPCLLYTSSFLVTGSAMAQPTPPPTTATFLRPSVCVATDVYKRQVQQVKEGFGCPLAVMGNSQILRAVYGHGDFLFLRCIHDPTHGLRHGIKEAAQLLVQLDDVYKRQAGRLMEEMRIANAIIKVPLMLNEIIDIRFFF